MTIKILNNLIAQLLFIFSLLSIVDYGYAELPETANFTTITTHNCVGYECEKSLYPQNSLDINYKNIDQTEYLAIIEQHINNIQTSQTNFPGFSSTIKRKLPNDLADKALHCHKAKALKVNWANSEQRTISLQFSHQCWQHKINQGNSHRHQKIERIDDIVYTVKIFRTPTSCSSAGYFVHPTKFKCIADPYREYSLLEMDENNFININIDGENTEFYVLGIKDNYDFDNSANQQSAETAASDVAVNNPADEGAPGVTTDQPVTTPGLDDEVDEPEIDESDHTDDIENSEPVEFEHDESFDIDVVEDDKRDD